MRQCQTKRSACQSAIGFTAMSGSDRHGNLTLALIVGAVLVFVVLLFAAIVSEHRAQMHRIYEDYQQNTAKEQRKAADKAARTCIGMEVVAITKCVSGQIAAHYNQQTTSQDLKAQKDMALWTFWMFVASCGTVLTAAIGIYYIRSTLEETRKTTKAGSIAAQAAQTSVKASREIAERELRAYACIESVRWKLDREAIQVSVLVKNFGQTPAYDLDVQGTSSLYEANEAPEFHEWDASDPKNTNRIGAGRPHPTIRCP